MTSLSSNSAQRNAQTCLDEKTLLYHKLYSSSKFRVDDEVQPPAYMEYCTSTKYCLLLSLIAASYEKNINWEFGGGETSTKVSDMYTTYNGKRDRNGDGFGLRFCTV